MEYTIGCSDLKVISRSHRICTFKNCAEFCTFVTWEVKVRFTFCVLRVRFSVRVRFIHSSVGVGIRVKVV